MIELNEYYGNGYIGALLIVLIVYQTFVLAVSDCICTTVVLSLYSTWMPLYYSVFVVSFSICRKFCFFGSPSNINIVFIY